MMVMKFTLWSLVVAVSASAFGIALLLNPTVRIGAVVANGVLVAVVSTVC